MFSSRYTIVFAAAALALAAALRLRDDVGVAVPFDPVTGDQCGLNLDANALVLKVSPQVVSCVDRPWTLVCILMKPGLRRNPDLSNPFCSPINIQNTGGVALNCTLFAYFYTPLRIAGGTYTVNDKPVSSAVSVVGFCASCSLNDIQASPALLKLMAGDDSAGADPLFGKIDFF
jgi:hypothetical protein